MKISTGNDKELTIKNNTIENSILSLYILYTQIPSNSYIIGYSIKNTINTANLEYHIKSGRVVPTKNMESFDDIVKEVLNITKYYEEEYNNGSPILYTSIFYTLEESNAFQEKTSQLKNTILSLQDNYTILISNKAITNALYTININKVNKYIHIIKQNK